MKEIIKYLILIPICLAISGSAIILCVFLGRSYLVPVSEPYNLSDCTEILTVAHGYDSETRRDAWEALYGLCEDMSEFAELRETADRHEPVRIMYGMVLYEKNIDRETLLRSMLEDLDYRDYDRTVLTYDALRENLTRDRDGCYSDLIKEYRYNDDGTKNNLAHRLYMQVTKR